jgi:hypothetical protein
MAYEVLSGIERSVFDGFWIERESGRAVDCCWKISCKSKLRSGSIDETGYAMLIAMDGVRLDLTRHARVTAVGFGF